MRRRLSLSLLGPAAGISALLSIALACGSSARIVGADVSPSDLPPAPTPDFVTDASPPPLPADATTDGEGGPPLTTSGRDGGDAGDAATCSTCVADGSPCWTVGAGTCAAGSFCCAAGCPSLSPPAPGFCDGGPAAALYDVGGCVTGYACAPVDCSVAGGTCVALVPSACAGGHAGVSTHYSCGGGLGVMCCLP